MTLRQIESRLAGHAIALLACLSLWVGPVALAEDMYRWEDANGRTHFGSAPPSGARNLRKLSTPDESSPHSAVNVIDGLPEKEPAKPRARPSPQTEAGQKLEALDRAEPSKIQGKSEAVWRRDARELEQKIEQLEQSLEYAEDQLTSSYGLSNSAFWQRRVEKIERDIERAEEQYDRFQERARGLGVPPGWLR